jgi:hypothetical protein
VNCKVNYAVYVRFIMPGWGFVWRARTSQGETVNVIICSISQVIPESSRCRSVVCSGRLFSGLRHSDANHHAPNRIEDTLVIFFCF